MNEIDIKDVEDALAESTPRETFTDFVAKRTAASEGFPKFQISKFLAGNRDYQVVIRTNDANELIQALKDIKPLVEQLEQKAGSTTSTPAPTYRDDLTSTCPIHNVPMEQKDGQYGMYWSHRIEGTGYCNGKKVTPFKKGY